MKIKIVVKKCHIPSSFLHIGDVIEFENLAENTSDILPLEVKNIKFFVSEEKDEEFILISINKELS